MLDRTDSKQVHGVALRFMRFMRAAAKRDANDPDVEAALADPDAWKDPEAHYWYAYLLARLGDGKRALALVW